MMIKHTAIIMTMMVKHTAAITTMIKELTITYPTYVVATIVILALGWYCLNKNKEGYDFRIRMKQRQHSGNVQLILETTSSL